MKSIIVHKEETLGYEIVVAHQPDAKWYNKHRYAWWVYDTNSQLRALKSGSAFFKTQAINAARGYIFDLEWPKVPENLKGNIK